MSAILALCTGCDYVLGLREHVDAPPMVDARPDAYFACERYKPAATTVDSDGDGVTDDLDNCPNVAGLQTDTDMDGVGDVCDPRPNNPGDCIVLFDNFMTDPRPTWTELGGNWQWSPGCSSKPRVRTRSRTSTSRSCSRRRRSW